jgi:outer membrane protein OmpA-like peptidoglycan-associated protein
LTVASQTKYYKGFLECSYTTDGKGRPVGSGSLYPTQSPIELEPRFRFLEAEEIPESEYPNIPPPKGTPFVYDIRPKEVEFHLKDVYDPIEGQKLAVVVELILFPENTTSPMAGQRPVADVIPLPDILHTKPGTEPFYRSFHATPSNSTLGRITGPAFAKVIEGRLLHELGVPQQPASGKPGCLGLPINFLLKAALAIKLTLASLMASFSLMMGRGGSGSNQPKPPGCGCLIPLLLLGLSALLLWLLGNNGCGRKETTPPVIIHDTVYKEVQKIDTLNIVRTDTVSYVDSTIQATFESIDLPNVQFFTNSDILLPTSASDLQKLAEYLIKNDSLTATIYGHTDSIGKDEDNMLLSQRRAESVRRFLTSLGVDGKRLEPVGMGETSPRADNSLLEGRLMNRRVEVKLVKSDFISTRRTRIDDSLSRSVRRRPNLRQSKRP